MSECWDRLLPLLEELTDLQNARRLLEYDQAVSMPPRGARSRARTIATIEALAHEKVIDPAIGDLLGELEEDESLTLEQKASVRVLKRDYDKATRLPTRLVKELAELTGLAYHAWTEARPASDFSILQPHIERMIELKKEEADALGWEEERYDALLDLFEPDMKASEAEQMLEQLMEGLAPLAEEILNAAGERPEWLTKTYDSDKQERFCQWLVEQLGFDKAAGRLDLSPHPFTLPLGAGDVRQTTRLDPHQLCSSIYAAIHETGHALYEQGIPEDLLDLPAGRVASLGLHESQSRLWENQVGRSRPFCDFMLPRLKELFPDELGIVQPEDFHRGVNYPQRTLIRVTADEVTYNFHVAIRFDIELALFRDELTVADLPDAWDEKYEKVLNIRPTGHADGILQDMHWSIGALGYFPTYTLGTLYAAAFYERAKADLGELDDDLRRGDGGRLLDWLHEHIHRHAYIYPPKELAEKVLGEPLTPQPFLDYLRSKYAEIYDLNA